MSGTEVAQSNNEAKVHDGTSWETVVEEKNPDDPVPMSPIEPGNGEIFVTVPSLRDGERCADTLKYIFDKAKDPDKVFVGIVEQNDEKDIKCIIRYCKKKGVVIKPRFPHDPQNFKCPYYNQIRYLAVYNKGAKGPAYARSLMRRLIGDEEFCLQIDAHSDFIEEWDQELKSQWHATENEYGIISTIPPSFGDKEVGSKDVRRMCHVHFAETNFIVNKKPHDGKVEGLTKPLLAHSWCAGFSFAKCHLEVTTPYDVFMPQVFDLEEFTRYARFWTRGYDVYTPTKQIVFHNYGKNPEGHVTRSWPMNNNERLASMQRAKTLLMYPEGLGPIEHANLGLYGLGKRRTLSQLEEFVGIDLSQKTVGNSECGYQKWVPYDLSISPFDNLYTEADDLNPQPEYPLRNALSAPFVQSLEDLKVDEEQLAAAEGIEPNLTEDGKVKETVEDVIAIPFKTLFLFWIIGLGAWFKVFVPLQEKDRRRKKRKDSKKMG